MGFIVFSDFVERSRDASARGVSGRDQQKENNRNRPKNSNKNQQQGGEKTSVIRGWDPGGGREADGWRSERWHSIKLMTKDKWNQS